MKQTINTIARVVLGLLLVVFGLNKFLDFMPPMELAENAQKFMNSLLDSGYMIPVIGLFEIIIGIMFLTNRWMKFALIALVPLTLNFLLFHLFLDLKNIAPAILVTVLQVFLFIKNYESFKTLLK